MSQRFPDTGKAKRGRIKVYKALAELENPSIGLTVKELIQKTNIGGLIMSHNLYGLFRKGIIDMRWQVTKKGARFAVVPGWNWSRATRILKIERTYTEIPGKAEVKKEEFKVIDTPLSLYIARLKELVKDAPEWAQADGRSARQWVEEELSVEINQELDRMQKAIPKR